MKKVFSPVVLRTLAATLMTVAVVGQAAAQTLPAPWRAADVGSPTLSGSTTAGSSGFTIDAAGADIWGTSDQFHFLYQQISGDVEVIARVDSISAAHVWSKAGVMIRASLNGNSAHGYALASAAKGVHFHRRSQTGGTSAHTSGSSSARTPVWVRAVRTGGQVTAYRSSNGTSWTQIGSSSIPLGSSAYVGVAVTSHNAGSRTTAQVSNVRVTRLGLPSGQQSTDIGGPAIAGSTAYSNGTYTIQAAGSDIWSGADEFHFVYQPMTGNGEVIARLASLGNTDSWAKAGVMIRESLTAQSRHAMTAVSAGNGYAFQRRTDAGAYSDHTAGGSGEAPGWVRLVRTGDLFEAYRSTNGTSWTLVGSDTIAMAATVYVGLAATSHNTGAATTAVFDNFSVTGGQPGGNQPPAVSITTPATGATYAAPAAVTIAASASDPESRMASVDFYAGSTLIARDTTSPYSVSWSATTAGSFPLTAVAHDADGGTTTSGTVTVTVQSSNRPPTVSLTSPSSGATFTAPATIALAATASDPDGSVARVEFYNGSTRLASDTSAPYSYSWSNVAAGTYNLTAVAFDAAGASGTSAVARVTVSAASSFPAPWTSSDIGSPALTGSSTYSGNVFTVDVGGRDIWDTSDEFHFIYQPISGDVDVRARVDGLVRQDDWTNAGVMVRSSLAANAIHAYTAVTSSRGVYLRQRTSTGGTTSSTQGSTAAAPAWVRLVRQGSLITSYTSADGSNWNVVGSQSLSLGGTVYVGLAVSSHNTAARTTARFSNVTVQVPSTTNRPPTVSLTSPSSGASFTAPATIALAATASDPENQLARVEFLSGSTRIATDTTAPYSFSWSGVAAGSYTITAVAYDTAGASATSAAVTVTVSGAVSTPPRYVVFTASADHATNVTSYQMRVYTSGANPATATPIATSDLAKPSPASNGDITVDRGSFFTGLAAGNYVATVMAVGPGGQTQSASVTFTR